MNDQLGGSLGRVSVEPERGSTGPCGSHARHVEASGIKSDNSTNLSNLLKELTFQNTLVDCLEKMSIILITSNVDSWSVGEVSGNLSSLSESNVISGSSLVLPEALSRGTATSRSLINDEGGLKVLGNRFKSSDEGVTGNISS